LPLDQMDLEKLGGQKTLHYFPFSVLLLLSTTFLV
jgi:hypothetical protein